MKEKVERPVKEEKSQEISISCSESNDNNETSTEAQTEKTIVGDRPVEDKGEPCFLFDK